MAIDYQVGDVVEPKATKWSQFKAEVLDITEKGAFLQILGSTLDPVFIKNSDLDKFVKSKTGTLLYGKSR